MKAKEVIQNTEKEQELAQSQIREVADYFHRNKGELFPRGEAVEKISEELNLEVPDHLTHDSFISQLIGDLVGDHVDPVQLVQNANAKYVGIVEYDEHSTYYTYDEYHDIEGKYKRSVCAACIHESSKSSEPFSRHTGNFGKPPYGDEEQLAEEMSVHVEAVHSGEDVEVETGATLASGTTIAGNTSFHAGNDGSASGLSADDVDGEEPPFPNSAIGNNSVTVNAGTDLINGGAVALGSSITIDHADTSAQGNVSTGGATVIDDIGLDGRGHIDNINTENRSLDQWGNANADVNFGNNRITAIEEIELNNIEDVGTAPVIGIDQSEGLLVDWGQGTAPALDGNNLSTGSNLTLSNATGASTNPSLSINQGSGSGLDADTVDGSEASEIGGGGSYFSYLEVKQSNGSVTAPDFDRADLFVSDDEQHLYVIVDKGFENESIEWYQMSTPGDLSTLSFQADVGFNACSALTFSPNGDRLVIGGGDNNDDITSYSLSTPWDITTISEIGSEVHNLSGSCTGIAGPSGGNFVYICANDGDGKWYEGSNWNFEFGDTVDEPIDTNQPGSITMSDSGEVMWVSFADDILRKYQIDTGPNGNADESAIIDYGSNWPLGSDGRGLSMADGTKLYLANEDGVYKIGPRNN